LLDWLSDSLTHPSIPSCLRLFICLLLVCLFACLLACSLIHSSIHSFPLSFTLSFDTLLLLWGQEGAVLSAFLMCEVLSGIQSSSVNVRSVPVCCTWELRCVCSSAVCDACTICLAHSLCSTSCKRLWKLCLSVFGCRQQHSMSALLSSLHLGSQTWLIYKNA